MKKIIKRVYKNKNSGQLLVTIPRNKGIKEGDFININLEYSPSDKNE